MWRGDYLYLIENLVLKDFKIRYRNMSLGVLWSLLNPLVMMGVYFYVFTYIFKNNVPDFPLFLLCGIVPFSFFTVGWGTGTTSIVDNAGLIKRVPVPREVIPITTVLSCCIHLLVQVALLLTVAVISHRTWNVHWLWLAPLWGLEVLFVSGLALLTSAINVFIRDTRYVVESAMLVLLFLVPVFYSSDIVPAEYRPILDYNPVAAVVTSLRTIVYAGQSPSATTLWKLVAVSASIFLLGLLVFHRLKPRFYEHI